MMQDTRFIEPFRGPLSEFPASAELPAGVKEIALEDTYGCGVDFMGDVEYAERDGEKLHLQIFLPTEGDPAMPQKDYPCIVFVQGSAWHRQHLFGHLSNLVRACEHGYVVAIVQYRPSEVAPFPAQMQDAKTAIRYLRKNAKQYRVLADKIALWGDSSGGHTALLAGITGDLGPDTKLYGEVSCAVRCIVDWYGTVDIGKMNFYPSAQNHVEADSPEGCLIGGKNVLENPDLVAPTVPMYYLDKGVRTPPILIMHGDRDQLVAFNQSCRLYNRLKELGKEVEMYKLKGAYHVVGGFNSDAALDIVLDFLGRHLAD
jgi:acetyl esterase/lipase